MRHRTVKKVIKTSKNHKAQPLHYEWQTCVWQAQVASEENVSHNFRAQRSISEKSGSVQKRGSDKILFLHLNGRSVGACSNMDFPAFEFLNTNWFLMTEKERKGEQPSSVPYQ